jgi:hypothetical protein
MACRECERLDKYEERITHIEDRINRNETHYMPVIDEYRQFKVMTESMLKAMADTVKGIDSKVEYMSTDMHEDLKEIKVSLKEGFIEATGKHEELQEKHESNSISITEVKGVQNKHWWAIALIASGMGVMALLGLNAVTDIATTKADMAATKEKAKEMKDSIDTIEGYFRGVPPDESK